MQTNNVSETIRLGFKKARTKEENVLNDDLNHILVENSTSTNQGNNK